MEIRHQLDTFGAMTKVFSKDVPVNQLQLVIWLFITAITSFSYFMYAEPIRSLVFGFMNIFSYFIIVNVNVYYLIPRFYKRNHKLLYLTSVLLLLLTVCWARVAFRSYFYARFYPQEQDTSTGMEVFVALLIPSILVYIISCILRVALDYFVLHREQERLKQHSAEMELKLLKAQVQPHFLFNTLNNIYYVAQQQSPETAALLSKLSNIMRYFVDTGQQQFIQLNEELNFIYDYIDLEKMRMRYPLQTTIREKGIINGIQVPPMLIIPLVENVFKHGIDKRSKTNELFLHINVEVESLSIDVRNRIFRPSVNKTMGVGLQNLRSRLQLLYKDQFRLDIVEKDNYYFATLNIPLYT